MTRLDAALAWAREAADPDDPADAAALATLEAAAAVVEAARVHDATGITRGSHSGRMLWHTLRVLDGDGEDSR